MDRRQEHEHDGQAGDQVRLEIADGQRPRGETACSAHAERMADGVERPHPCEDVTHEGQRADAQEHPGEDEDHLVRAGPVILPGERRNLHIGEPKTHRRRVRNDEQQEHHDAEAADEMRGGAPEQQAPRQRLDILQDGGAGGREARYALEPGVHESKRPTPKGIGKHPEHEGQEPGQEDNHIPVLQAHMRGFPHEDEGEDTHGESQGETDQKRRQGAVSPVRERDEHGQQHKQRTHQERDADIPRYDFQVHSRSCEAACDSFSSLTRRRSCRFSSASSVMPSFSSDSWSSPSKE